jgi:hypothetical protein
LAGKSKYPPKRPSRKSLRAASALHAPLAKVDQQQLDLPIDRTIEAGVVVVRCAIKLTSWRKQWDR